MFYHPVQRRPLWITCQLLLKPFTRSQPLAYHQRCKELPSCLPMQIDRTLGYTCLPCYIINSRLAISPTLQQFSSCIQDTLRPPLSPAPFLLRSTLSLLPTGHSSSSFMMTK